MVQSFIFWERQPEKLAGILLGIYRIKNSAKKVFLRNPFEVVKQQMQVGWNTSFISTAKEIKRISGPKGKN